MCQNDDLSNISSALEREKSHWNKDPVSMEAARLQEWTSLAKILRLTRPCDKMHRRSAASICL